MILEASPEKGSDNISLYSCPNLVMPKMEELISRPFVGQIQFRLVLQKDMGTESAIGCLVFSLALTFFVSQKFAVLKAGQLAGSFFANMVGKMRNTCEHQRVRRLR